MNKKYCQECGRLGFHYFCQETLDTEILKKLIEILSDIEDRVFSSLDSSEIVEVFGKKYRIGDLLHCFEKRNLRDNWFSEKREPIRRPHEINKDNNCKWFKSIKECSEEPKDE